MQRYTVYCRTVRYAPCGSIPHVNSSVLQYACQFPIVFLSLACCTADNAHIVHSDPQNISGACTNFHGAYQCSVCKGEMEKREEIKNQMISAPTWQWWMPARQREANLNILDSTFNSMTNKHIPPHIIHKQTSGRRMLQTSPFARKSRLSDRASPILWAAPQCTHPKLDQMRLLLLPVSPGMTMEGDCHIVIHFDCRLPFESLQYKDWISCVVITLAIPLLCNCNTPVVFLYNYVMLFAA